MKHPHAELMLLYAQDAMETDKPWERWEFSASRNIWTSLNATPQWDIKSQYRRKPRAININGFEVPEPVRKELDQETPYFYPSVFYYDYFDSDIWSGSDEDINALKKGIIHLTQEAAALHGKALASFTERKK